MLKDFIDKINYGFLSKNLSKIYKKNIYKYIIYTEYNGLYMWYMWKNV